MATLEIPNLQHHTSINQCLTFSYFDSFSIEPDYIVWGKVNIYLNARFVTKGPTQNHAPHLGPQIISCGNSSKKRGGMNDFRYDGRLVVWKP